MSLIVNVCREMLSFEPDTLAVLTFCSQWRDKHSYSTDQLEYFEWLLYMENNQALCLSTADKGSLRSFL